LVKVCTTVKLTRKLYPAGITGAGTPGAVGIPGQVMFSFTSILLLITKLEIVVDIL
jgi:hypothetical protein